MLLLDLHGAKADSFAHLENGEKIAGKTPLVPFAALETELRRANGAPQIGVLIDKQRQDGGAGALVRQARADRDPLPQRRPTVAAFRSPGNCASAAITGLLRASGPLFSDQFPQALACGFDEVEIPDANAARQPVEQWLAARDRITSRLSARRTAWARAFLTSAARARSNKA